MKLRTTQANNKKLSIQYRAIVSVLNSRVYWHNRISTKTNFLLKSNMCI